MDQGETVHATGRPYSIFPSPFCWWESGWVAFGVVSQRQSKADGQQNTKKSFCVCIYVCSRVSMHFYGCGYKVAPSSFCACVSSFDCMYLLRTCDCVIAGTCEVYSLSLRQFSLTGVNSILNKGLVHYTHIHINSHFH